MTSKEIRNLSVAEIEKTIRETRDKSLELKLRKQTGQLENTAEVTRLRKVIARLESIRAEKLKVEEKSA
ncbi:50S ribosomal protein L29 [Puniceicoccaceae bacterium K14]|nr:50S ribosomal protein L29 [Puniceicoccaceae bacterium K14]